MRPLAITVIVALMTSGVAWAQIPSNVSMTLRADKTGVAPGEAFTATLSIAADAPLVAWNAKFRGPAGFAVTPSYLGAENGWDINVENGAISWTNSVLPLQTANGTGMLGTIAADVFVGARSSDIFRMVLTVPAAQPLGTVFVTATDAVAGDLQFNDHFLVVAPLPINIIPEPGSLLLLALGGMAVMWRRT